MVGKRGGELGLIALAQDDRRTGLNGEQIRGTGGKRARVNRQFVVMEEGACRSQRLAGGAGMALGRRTGAPRLDLI